MVPLRFDLHVAPVEAPRAYTSAVEFWRSKPHGVDYSPTLELALNRSYTFNLQRGALLADPCNLHTVDFERLESDTVTIERSLDFEATREGTIFGMAGWFTAHLTDDIALSTLDDSTHWRVTFYPVERPIRVREGDRVAVGITADRPLTKTVWTWSVRGPDGVAQEHSNRLFLDHVLQRGPAHRPVVPEDRRRQLVFVLERCDGTRSIEELARELRTALPAAYEDQRAATAAVVEMTEQMGIPTRRPPDS